MEELKVDTVIISKQGEYSENFQKFKQIVKKKKIKVIVVEQGDRINIENDVCLDILWPKKSNLINKNILNNNSIVCKLVYNNFSILFTGDIEKEAEREILDRYNNNQQILNCNILKVAHHGSNTSSIKELLEVVKPKVALIGVGQNNTFGHPSDEIITRLENIGTKVYRTDEDGEISITIKNKGNFMVNEFIK